MENITVTLRYGPNELLYHGDPKSIGELLDEKTSRALGLNINIDAYVGGVIHDHEEVLKGNLVVDLFDKPGSRCDMDEHGFCPNPMCRLEDGQCNP